MGNIRENEEIEIDVGQILSLLKKNIKKIIVVVLLFMIVSALLTTFVITKKYNSSSRVLLKPNTVEGVVDSTQISSNKAMVNNYMELLKGDNIQTQVAEETGIAMAEVAAAISVSNQTDTQIIEITATTDSPEKSKIIVDSAVDVFYAEIRETLNVTNVITVDHAKVATSPSSPSLPTNIGIGAVAGLFVSCAFVFIRFISDSRIRNKEDAEQYLGIPSLGVVPDFKG